MISDRPGPRRRAAACLCVALLAAGCSGAGEPATSSAPEVERPGASARRQPTRPRRPRVVNSASGHSRWLIARAVQDLRRTRFWEPLTAHLYKIYLSSRDGSVNVPDDRHLADALLTAAIDRRGSGTLCDIRFYPAAMRQDLVRQWNYFEAGQLGARPPTLRRFWVSILGHELAHCLPHPDPMRQVGERIALR